MRDFLLAPPVAFIIILVAVYIFAAFLSRFSFRRKNRSPDIEKSYACGEEMPTNFIQPDYSQFFPFAFFFTILHVVTLIISTVPIETIESFTIAITYILGAIIGLVILFRR